VLFSLQTRMIFPGAVTQGTPGAEVKPSPGTDLVRLKTASGVRVVALFGPALSATGKPLPDASRRPTMISFYGNGTCLRHTVDSDFARFRRLGVNVMIPEYIGYGMSGGLPSESGCYETADAAYSHLKARRDIDPGRIIAVGRSLGGAVAIDLAARQEVAGLIVFSTFTRMSDMARRQFPVSVLPVSLLLRHRFDSLSKIGRVTCPILIGHGRNDGVVPHEMAGLLAAAAKAPVTTFTVEGADHNDLDDVNGDQVAEALRVFLAKFPAPRPR
jgi:fermentation-respiration switch protein FrsA (DUF1100 family)